jgi:hypothetical protein
LDFLSSFYGWLLLDGWLVVGKKCGKFPTMWLVDAVHAGYIAGLSLVRICSADARQAPVYKCTQFGTEAGIYSCINDPSRVCAPRVLTKHCRSLKQKWSDTGRVMYLHWNNYIMGIEPRWAQREACRRGQARRLCNKWRQSRSLLHRWACYNLDLELQLNSNMFDTIIRNWLLCQNPENIFSKRTPRRCRLTLAFAW